MRTIVFGAAGGVGSIVVAEALMRGHEVTAVVRRREQLADMPAGVQACLGDATQLDDVVALSVGHDVVIGATRPATGSEQDLVDTAGVLLAASRQTGARLILVGGAASLRAPDTGDLVVDDPRYTPVFIHAIVEACHRQHQACMADQQADWTYISPPALLLPGVRTGRYLRGEDELIVDAEGRSTISVEDFALALLDEVETPGASRSRFTVAARALPTIEADVMVKTADGVADGFLVHPASGAHPGVLLWPDAVGLRPAYRAMARRLAGAGYSVLVINANYRHGPAPLEVDMVGFYEPAGRDRVMTLSQAITPQMLMNDSVALVDYLDAHAAVDSSRKLGAVGYCVGGTRALWSAAARPDRIGAYASFHGAGLVSEDEGSPHRLISWTKAQAVMAIAENDDEADPAAKTCLREAFAAAGLYAEVEVFEGATHGWCVPDARASDPVLAERAWSRLLVLLDRALT